MIVDVALWTLAAVTFLVYAVLAASSPTASDPLVFSLFALMFLIVWWRLTRRHRK